ncbi:MAG: hypothetical protein JO365_07740 [Bradyrhizobium sp.]|nr:hypothetical protein [Bradyrhizobium sp.]
MISVEPDEIRALICVGVGTGTLGVGVGVGEAVGVGVGVGDDVCAWATCAVIVRAENRTTVTAGSLVSPRIPLFPGFIDLDARHMNQTSETAKPAYGQKPD